MMSATSDSNNTDQSRPVSALRVRITKGPDQNVIGKIGYLFDFNAKEERSYILTVTDTEVRRLHLQDGYQYQIEEV